MMKRNKTLTLFVTGGSIYFLIEVIWKSLRATGIVHWSMFLLGGLCFLLIGGLNEYIPWDWSLVKQGAAGSVIVTALEFAFGCVLNLWLKLGVWDYSNFPFNILGQICLPFTILWFFFSLIAIFLDDYLRYKWYREEKPHYHLF